MESTSAQTLIVCHCSTKITCYMDGTFFQVFSKVQLNVSCSIKLFTGLLNFVDMSSKATHTDASFGYSYSVAMPSIAH